MNTILETGFKRGEGSSLEEVIPENCQLLITSKPNLEIATVAGVNICNIDMEIEQNQLERRLLIRSQILSIAHSRGARYNAIRILADLRLIQSKARIN